MQHGVGEFTAAALERAGVDDTVVELTDAFLAVMDRMRQHLEQVAAQHGLNAPTALALHLLGLLQRALTATDADAAPAA